jgi:hypothetical protein
MSQGDALRRILRCRGDCPVSRFNFVPANALNGSPQIVHREMSISLRHEHHCGRAQGHDLRDLGNRSPRSGSTTGVPCLASSEVAFSQGRSCLAAAVSAYSSCRIARDGPLGFTLFLRPKECKKSPQRVQRQIDSPFQIPKGEDHVQSPKSRPL